MHRRKLHGNLWAWISVLLWLHNFDPTAYSKYDEFMWETGKWQSALPGETRVELGDSRRTAVAPPPPSVTQRDVLPLPPPPPRSVHRLLQLSQRGATRVCPMRVLRSSGADEVLNSCPAWHRREEEVIFNGPHSNGNHYYFIFSPPAVLLKIKHFFCFVLHQ